LNLQLLRYGGDSGGNVSTLISASVLGTGLISNYLIQPRVRYTPVCADLPSGMHSGYIAVASEVGHRRYERAFLLSSLLDSEFLSVGLHREHVLRVRLQIQAQNVCSMDHVA
jgi:hypothetical protein